MGEVYEYSTVTMGPGFVIGVPCSIPPTENSVLGTQYLSPLTILKVSCHTIIVICEVLISHIDHSKYKVIVAPALEPNDSIVMVFMGDDQSVTTKGLIVQSHAVSG